MTLQINPQVITADLTQSGIPVLGGYNQAGIGFVGYGVPGVAALNINVVNLGGGNSGAYNSAIVNIWGGSPNGDTQNMILFYNATGPNGRGNPGDGEIGATPAGARLGEVAGCGTLNSGWFTQTETWSLNGYAAKAFTGNSPDGQYTAPTNIVLRVAPNGPLPERNIAIFDFNGNVYLGGSCPANEAPAWPDIPIQGDYSQNTIYMTHSHKDPEINPPQYGGALYCVAGYLKFKSFTGNITVLATP